MPIRTQVHIDLAATFDGPDEVLPTKYALDGLHLDVDGKILMGETIVLPGRPSQPWLKCR